MSATEVFHTPCWNFVGGDREIERHLRELPPRAGVVVRNRLANVVATVAGLADLERVSPLKLRVRVPRNAIAGAPELTVAPGRFFETLLSRCYGVSTVEAPAPGATLLAIGFGESAPDAVALAAVLSQQPDLPVIFLNPPGQPLAPVLRPLLGSAWSSRHWEGLSAFSSPAVEEAVAELAPERLLVCAASEAVAAHTAIGAVDWLLRERARRGEALSLRSAGERVSVLRLSPAVPGAPEPFLELVLRHLRSDLGVESVAEDPRFVPTREAIAIDLV